MSTLKVNAIEPYSGGTVTITGASIASASYAETANTLTAGDKTIEGMLSINGTSTLDPIISATGSSYFNGNVYVNQGNVDINTGQFLGRRLEVTNRIRLEDGANYKNTLSQQRLSLEKETGYYGIELSNESQVDGAPSIDILTPAFPGATFGVPNQQIVFQRGDAYTDGTITMKNPVTINGNETLNGNLVQDQAGTNAVLLLQNPAFYSEYHGNTLQWFPNSGLGGNAILTVAEKAEAALQANSFPADFSYDHVVTIKANANGAQFADWDLPSYGDNIWLQIPDQGTPSFKRGLDIQGGSITLPGLGDYVDDAAAATGGVPIDGVYRTGSTLKIRVS